MLASKENISNFIPQREPMVMIHELIEATHDQAVTRFTVEQANILVSDDRLSEAGMIENMAQTAAAQFGYQCSIKKIPVPVGYIAVVKDLKIYDLPKKDDRITTSVSITNKIMDVTMVEGRIEKDGKLYCSCEMRIFVKL